MRTHDVNDAMNAWKAGRRRRAFTGTVERFVDAVMAAGAVLVANAALPIELGLPEGKIGISLGLALMCAGLAWITRHRAAAFRPQRPAYARMPVVAPIEVAPLRAAAHVRRAA